MPLKSFDFVFPVPYYLGHTVYTIQIPPSYDVPIRYSLLNFDKFQENLKALDFLQKIGVSWEKNTNWRQRSKEIFQFFTCSEFQVTMQVMKYLKLHTKVQFVQQQTRAANTCRVNHKGYEFNDDIKVNLKLFLTTMVWLCSRHFGSYQQSVTQL